MFSKKEQIKIAKERYYLQIIEECKGNQRKLFSVVNTLLGMEKIHSLLTAESGRILAETFSDFFISKISKIRNDLSELEETTTPLSCPPVTDLIEFWTMMVEKKGTGVTAASRLRSNCYCGLK